MEKYLDIIYHYYPKNIYASDLNYSYTPEITRLFKLLERTRQDDQTFEELKSKFSKEFNQVLIDHSLSGVFCLSFMSDLYISNDWDINFYKLCAFNISVVSNYYCVYLTQINYQGANTLQTGPTTENERTFIDYVEKRILEFYPDYIPFPMENFNEKVPGVYSGGRNPLEYATYFECLVTNHIL